MSPKGHLREHSSLLLWIMRLTDVAVSLLFCGLGYAIVFAGPHSPPSVLLYQIAVLFSVPLQILLFQSFSVYQPWRGEDYLQEFVAVLMAWTVIFAILAFLTVITKTSENFSRAWLVTWFLGGGMGILTTRFLLRNLLKRLRARGYNLRHIILFAEGDTGWRVYETLCHAPETGLNIRAYFSSSLPSGLPDVVHRGSIEEGIDYTRTSNADQIWIAMSLKDEAEIEHIVRQLRDTTADIRLVPDLFGYRLINHSISNIANMSVINLSITPMDGVNRWVKAFEDKIFAALILLLISPLFAAIAIAVKLSSPGPVFYRQERLSWNGRKFQMLKFRSMPVDSEANSGPKWATPNESRATRVGAFLRRTSLDELPQFLNVLQGDMSIVGPRPERPVFVEQFKDEIPSYMQKHLVKAGITGWAQINGWRGDTDLHQRIEHDLYYIENWSLWLDLKIIVMTLFKGFIHKNAY
ncbi:undecaprenyl-phosphate glucose phosphotransferase [Haliea sp. E17]|uniref:undecaprenyl-phosphate glucose phosphotransferase n=1 Tax=Haliea sp. E17 TaxID=3401576 RepID=UPI003AADD12E